jgi:S1-C subfamily serine protease
MIDAGDGYGTGWLLEPGLIVTAQHVVVGKAEITVRQAGNPPFIGKVVATDAQRDVALISYQTGNVALPTGAQPLALAPAFTGATNASPVLLLGYSGAGAPKSDGTVGAAGAKAGVQSQAVRFDSAATPVINVQIDAPADPGDSGGPLFNTAGQVIGLLRAQVISTPGGQRIVGIFYAVSVDEIKAALPELRAGRSK